MVSGRQPAKRPIYAGLLYKGLNYSDPFGLCPVERDGIPCSTAGVGVGAAFGAGVGVAITAGCASVTVGICTAGGPLIVGVSSGLGGSIGGALGALYDYVHANEADDSPKGSKSAGEYDEHQRKLGEARGQLEGLRDKLREAKGPKARGPIREQIRDLETDIKGHEKEIRQKWPDGRPE